MRRTTAAIVAPTALAALLALAGCNGSTTHSLRTGSSDALVRRSAPVARGFAAAGEAATTIPSPLQLPTAGTPIAVTGAARGGQTVTVHAERLADGTVAFIDSTQPGADRTTGKNLIVIYDGVNVKAYEGLPGPVATMREGDTPDPDVLSAAWATRSLLDRFRTEFGQDSWDGKGSPFRVSVHLTQELNDCNSSFSNGLLRFTGRCTSGETTLFDSPVDVGIATFAVVYGQLFALYPDLFETTTQGGAVMLGTADYLSVTTQNRLIRTPSTAVAASRCVGQAASWACVRFPDGSVGLRTVDSGAVLDDATHSLREPRGTLDSVYDYAGTYDNAMVWSNALWQVRKAFAGEDGGDVVNSAAANRFDRILYRAFTTYFTNDTDLALAAAAVVQAATDLAASAAELEVIQQQFVASQFCAGCTTVEVKGNPVAVTPRIEYRPHVVNGGIAYLSRVPGSATSNGHNEMMFAPGGDPTRAVNLSPAGTSSLTLVGAGDWLVDRRYDLATGNWLGVYIRNIRTSSEERLDDVRGYVDPAVSGSTVVWTSYDGDTPILKARSTTGGLIATLALSGKPILLGADGPLVAYQLQNGIVGTWNVQTNTTKDVGTVVGMNDSYLVDAGQIPGSIVVSGSRVAVLSPQKFYSAPYTLQVWDVTTGKGTVISQNAFPAGVAMSGDLIVWPEANGEQGSAVSKLLGSTAVDSELMAYSFSTNTFVNLLAQIGQQGFPSIANGLLAWQDSVNWSDDIYSAAMPTSL